MDTQAQELRVMMTRYWYKQFRKNDSRLSASNALYMARTLEEWRDLEALGVVRLEAEPDSDMYDPGDCLDGLSEESKRRFWDRINDTGVWGVVGSYLCPCCGEFVVSDSIWGCAGYDNVLSPLENYYVPDIMAETIEAYKNAKGE